MKKYLPISIIFFITMSLALDIDSAIQVNQSDVQSRYFIGSATIEGIVLDPVYSGKGFSGLLGRIREGGFGADDQIVFIHTGGTPALFAYAEQLYLEFRSNNDQAG